MKFRIFPEFGFFALCQVKVLNNDMSKCAIKTVETSNLSHTLKTRIRAWRKKSSTVVVSFRIKILGTKNLKKKIKNNKYVKLLLFGLGNLFLLNSPVCTTCIKKTSLESGLHEGSKS